MTDVGASYAFLPWVRTGLAGEITRADGTGATEPRASVAVTLVVDAAGERRPVTTTLGLFGPGEVAALDPRAVIRQTPTTGELDANPNELPMVEFGEPDLPWRFTPATNDASGRLRPWLVLAVLAADEITDEAPAGSDGRLAAITVASAAALPRLDQSWAWSHVQVDGFDPATESLATVDPRRLRSRLLASRHLAAKTAYTAVLVPAFERGRLAGLREPLAETVDGLTPAWQPTASTIRLPVYHRWSFQTGEQTDFEHLARRLTARHAGDTVGLARMDVGAPDPALPAASSEPLEVTGALASPTAVAREWPAGERGTYEAALAKLLNQPADVLAHDPDGARIVAPPLWGRWHAARNRLDPTADAQPEWFHELNGDPRLRVAAGLGAEVVRRNDEQLMATAWDQVEGILEANAQLRRAQVARAASAKLHDRHLSTLDADTLLQVTGPLHARFLDASAPPGALAGPTATVARRIAESPIPAGALDGTLRRARAKVARRAGAPGGPSGLLDRLNRGEVRAEPAAPVAEGMLVAGLVPERVVGRATVVSRATVVERSASSAARATAGPVFSATLTWRPGTSAGGVGPGPRGGGGLHVPVRIDDDPRDEPVLARSAERFHAAYVDLLDDTEAAPTPGPVLRQLNLTSVAATLVSTMDPRRTIAAATRDRIAIAPWVVWGNEDPLEPVLVAPEFDTPMYEPLRDLGQDWLLPGAGSIPPDTVTMVVSNQRFIEAYLAGLSHEMGRELLYHEYPTDQRGTYFRQFWDVRGFVDATGSAPDPRTLHDIRPIHHWRTSLGANSGRVPVPTQGHLVLLIKSELFRRYPGTLVTAAPAVIGADGLRALGTPELHPIFAGRLEPDIAFFGFDLLPEQARGGGTNLGWFFVLAEHPTEPRFGLDADNGEYGGRPATWNDLNWAHTAANTDALSGLGYLDLDADLPDTTGVTAALGEPPLAWHAGRGLGPAGANGSDLAWITLQRPFRVAIHGADMLPKGDTP